MAAATLDPLFLAYSKFRRRKLDDCITGCTAILAKQPDQAAWFLKARALTQQDYVDDLDIEDESVADAVMDENAIAKAPRPGTSLKAGGASGGATAANSVLAGDRPLTGTARPLSGFVRPGTQSRGKPTSSGGIEGALQGPRPGTSRPLSTADRLVRLGTQSMLAAGDRFIVVERLDLSKYARRGPLAKVLCDYLLYVEHNPKLAMQLCAEATVACEYADWWWKARLAKCYYQLGMLRDAERQFKSALAHQECVATSLELAKVYIRLDQPNTALDCYEKTAAAFSGEKSLILGMARVYDELALTEKAVTLYQRVLQCDASNVESIAQLASFYFYEDQPEVALRLYRRLLQMGVNNCEVWNNLGLSCFYASQYDYCLSCFERALRLASDEDMADIWFNISLVAVGIGDLKLAHQALKIALSMDPNHAEAFNNLGVLELQRKNIEQARSHFESSHKIAPHLHEPFYNAALLAFKLGDCQESYSLATKALQAEPEHSDSKDLLRQLDRHFSML